MVKKTSALKDGEADTMFVRIVAYAASSFAVSSNKSIGVNVFVEFSMTVPTVVEVDLICRGEKVTVNEDVFVSLLAP